MAVDIGTTTVAMDLVRLSDGKVLSQGSMLNAQKRFGQEYLPESLTSMIIQRPEQQSCGKRSWIR